MECDVPLRRRTFLGMMAMAAPATLISRKATAEMPRRSIALLDAPSNLGLRPPRENHEPGAWRLPKALRDRGLLEKLTAHDAGVVPRLAYSPEPNDETGFLNGPLLATYTQQLAGKIGSLLEEKYFPLILGGDCSILLGAALALRRRGRYGLCFIDGHNDFSYALDPARRGRYTAAGLDLALSTGHGPPALCDIDHLQPYLREDDVVALGLIRLSTDNPDYDVASFYRSKITPIEADRVVDEGAGKCAQSALENFGRTVLAGFWIHLDADVLNSTVMPAVDSPNPFGLTIEQLHDILRELLASPRVVGMHVTILDPERDPDGACVDRMVDLLTSAFSA